MSLVQFSHANGFPAATYQYLFDQLPELEFRAIPRIGEQVGDFERNFQHLATELIAATETHGKPVIGMGHSLGGVITLLAAGRRPDLFEEVVLLDPPVFSHWKRSIIRVLQHLGMGDQLGPTKKALTRRATFSSHEEAKEYFGGKAFFQRFHPETFRAYVAHGLKPDGDQLTLAIPREFETEVFRTIQTAVPKDTRQVRGTLIYGVKSDLFWKSDARWWQRTFPNMTLRPFPGGHLFPLEQPDATAEVIRHIMGGATFPQA